MVVRRLWRQENKAEMECEEERVECVTSLAMTSVHSSLGCVGCRGYSTSFPNNISTRRLNHHALVTKITNFVHINLKNVITNS